MGDAAGGITPVMRVARDKKRRTNGREADEAVDCSDRKFGFPQY
jgi:hypothetical protein